MRRLRLNKASAPQPTPVERLLLHVLYEAKWKFFYVGVSRISDPTNYSIMDMMFVFQAEELDDDFALFMREADAYSKYQFIGVDDLLVFREQKHGDEFVLEMNKHLEEYAYND